MVAKEINIIWTYSKIEITRYHHGLEKGLKKDVQDLNTNLLKILLRINEVLNKWKDNTEFTEDSILK